MINKFLRRKLNNKGMSLIELMVAIGLMSIVSLGVGTMMTNMGKNASMLSSKDELLSKKRYFQKMLSENMTWANTINAAVNVNAQCLRDRVACSAAYVANAYNNTQDRLVLYDNGPSPGRVLYDSTAASSSGFTLKGIPCTGFSATGGGNDACPLGYVFTWFLSAPSATSNKGVTMTIVGKMVFNPSNNNPMKKLINANFSSNAIGNYDVAASKNIASVLDFTTNKCTQGSVTINNTASYPFYPTSSVALGQKCIAQMRTCSIFNNTPILSGTATNETCTQNCSGFWTPCSQNCGGGVQSWTETVPAFGPGAVACGAANGDTRTCNNFPCPIDCRGQWNTCSNGVQYYNVTTQPQYGGATCPFADGAAQACGTNCVGAFSACSNGSQTYSISTQPSGGGRLCPYVNGTTQPCGVNCVGSWSSCASSIQTYTVTTQPSGGGRVCPYNNGATLSCGTNCVGNWSACANGSQYYTVTTPASGGGAVCPAANGQTQNCGTTCIGSWGSCSNGSQTYTVTTPAAGGGQNCPYSNGATQACGINCIGNWSTCSGGVQYYTVTTPASGGGIACSNATNDTRSCGVDCVGAWGSCSGGVKTYNVSTPASGGGTSCPYVNGATQVCGLNNCADVYSGLNYRSDNTSHINTCPANKVMTKVTIWANKYLDGGKNNYDPATPMHSTCCNIDTAVYSGSSMTIYAGKDYNQDNTEHATFCPAGYFMTGISIFSTDYFDGYLNITCNTFSGLSYASTDYGSASSSGITYYGSDDTYHATTCPGNNVLAGISFWATSRFDNIARERCYSLTAYVTCGWSTGFAYGNAAASPCVYSNGKPQNPNTGLPSAYVPNASYCTTAADNGAYAICTDPSTTTSYYFCSCN
jgi:prepilin-type N-terminal cleavage/methylation domain-containing protein